MKSAKFEYKCRRCGEIELLYETKIEIAKDEMRVLNQGKVFDAVIAPTLQRIHCCADGGWGFANLRGFRVEGK